MYIQKRDKKFEKFSEQKIKKVVQYACSKYPNCDALELEVDAHIQIKNRMKTEDVQKVLIQTAIEKVLSREYDTYGNPITNINTDWQYVASNLLAYDLYKKARLTREYDNFGYGDFSELLDFGIKNNLYDKSLMTDYNINSIKELGSYIKMERDELLSYYGLNLLATRYLVQYDKKVFELPQERFMIVAMHLASCEDTEEKRVSYAKKYYDLMSKLKITVATPTLANAGTTFGQLSSCFIATVDDNLWSIYDVNSKFAQVSKHGGAIGIYLGKLRSLNSDIRGVEKASGGIIPWIRLYNDTAVAVDQLGRRKGSATVSLDVWHADLYDFLALRTNNGDDRRKAHDIFTSINIPNIFMERVKERGEWCLFDPHQIRKIMGYSLEDYYDDNYKNEKEFTERYLECESNPNLNKIKVKALDIMKKIMQSAVETGTPFLFFRDTVNSDNPNKHKGIIYCSNLCHEIAQNTSSSELHNEDWVKGHDDIITIAKAGDFVTCNLSSINLGKLETLEELQDIIPLQVRILDSVITKNELPLYDARITSDKYRAIGLGVSGYHQYLVNRKIKWEDETHLTEVEKLFNEISYQTIKASMELSKEKGSYPAFKGSEWETGKYFERNNLTDERWTELREQVKENGMRNGYLLAIAPTGSTSHISDSTAGIDPVFAKYFVEEKKGATLPKTAPNLNDANYWLYKEAHNINQEWSIDACGIRQRFIDQAQSFNLYINPNMTAQEIFNLYIRCWEKGLKTLYYVRNKSLEVDECVSCSS